MASRPTGPEPSILGHTDAVRDPAAAREESFRALFEPVRFRLYSFIRKTLGFSTEADDVFQETALNAFRYFDSFRRDGDFAAWVFGIADNEIRRSRRNPAAASLDPATATIPDDVSRREMVRTVFDAAFLLPPRRRIVFFLYYDSGFTIPEIARITGLREGNVKFILNRVRKELRRLLGESP